MTLNKDMTPDSPRGDGCLSIAKNLADFTAKIRTFEQRYHREPHSVTLLPVSKTHTVDKIQEAIAAGARAFGENYLQEALEKIAFFNNDALEWHFLGPLQSNKTKKIAENFAWVHSVADLSLAKRLNNQRPTSLPPLNICIQVNTSGESQKSGINPTELASLAENILTLPRLQLRGIMALPAPKNIFAEQRADCYQIAIILQNLREKGFILDTLSMGMTNDLEAAIAEGSTLVRIGTGIFGQRQ